MYSSIRNSEWPKLKLHRLITKPRISFATPFVPFSSILTERIFQYSDSLIPENLRVELLESVNVLESVPEKKKDSSPGSHNQVLNLVHPSLYPIIYGQSRTVAGDIVEQPYPGHEFSSAFCWLPTEFLIHTDGTVSIDSYINNLHPGQYSVLYATLEKVFAKFVPLFERVLTDIVLPPQLPPPIRKRKRPSVNLPSTSTSSRAIFQVPKSVPVALAGRNVQVIVKMTNIILTPENPSYPGGVWHVEGMRNENIVASGIYYYDVINISESKLRFRQEATLFYHNDRGSLDTPNNRCLVFPNIYEHRVSPFWLTDPIPPGHRKMLIFFLVNPEERILSTSTIPPQQLDSFLEELSQIHPFHDVPIEIVTHIGQFLDWPLSLAKAKNVRAKMIRERKVVVDRSKQEKELIEWRYRRNCMD